MPAPLNTAVMYNRLAKTTIKPAENLAASLPKRKPMKSGIVTESNEAVTWRSRGATQRHETMQKIVMIGTKSSHGNP